MPELKTCLIVMAAALLTATGCARQEPEVETDEIAVAPVETEPEPMVAVATLLGRDGDLIGTVSFTQTGDGVAVVADVQGVEPGLHGLHLHAVGDCSAPDFSSAGDHFNPDGAPHGCPPEAMSAEETAPGAMAEGAETETMDAGGESAGEMAAGHHAGDFGNIEVGEDGTGHLELTTRLLTVDPGPSSAVGKAVVLHSDEDDCTSQPSGDSGERIACGVVELAEAQFGGTGAEGDMTPGAMPEGDTTTGGQP